jgi:hypothetical protein
MKLIVSESGLESRTYFIEHSLVENVLINPIFFFQNN